MAVSRLSGSVGGGTGSVSSFTVGYRHSTPVRVSPTRVRSAFSSSAAEVRSPVSLPARGSTPSARLLGSSSTKPTCSSLSSSAASNPLRDARLAASVLSLSSAGLRSVAVRTSVVWLSRTPPVPRSSSARNPPSLFGVSTSVATPGRARASAVTYAGSVRPSPSRTTDVPNRGASSSGSATTVIVTAHARAGAMARRPRTVSPITAAPPSPSQARLSAAPGQMPTGSGPMDVTAMRLTATAVPKPRTAIASEHAARVAPGRNNAASATSTSGATSAITTVAGLAQGRAAASTMLSHEPIPSAGKPSASIQAGAGSNGAGIPGSASKASQLPRVP